MLISSQSRGRKRARFETCARLQATELVHEAYVRLANIEDAHNWIGREHFFAEAAEAMRRNLVEQV